MPTPAGAARGTEPPGGMTRHSRRLLLQGVNVTALREIKLLRELRSPHLVSLLDVFPHKRKNLLLVRHGPRHSEPATFQADGAVWASSQGSPCREANRYAGAFRVRPQVFEYCETDLELVIKDRSLIFAPADVKAYMQVPPAPDPTVVPGGRF